MLIRDKEVMAILMRSHRIIWDVLLETRREVTLIIK